MAKHHEKPKVKMKKESKHEEMHDKKEKMMMKKEKPMKKEMKTKK